MASNHTIRERILLDGGAEIEKEFAAMGAAGKAAYAQLKQAALDSQKAQTGFSAIFAQAGKDLKNIEKQAQATAKAYREFSDSAKKVVTNVALVTGAVVGASVAFVEFVKHAADTADQTDKAAQAAGLSIDTYGKLQFVFEQGNVSADAFGTAMKKLNTNLAEAATGSGTGAKLFNQLGISVKGANGQLKPTDQILQELADKFQKMPDGPQKSALAIQLFGKAGASIIPVLNDGGKAMLGLEARAVSLGLVLDKTAGKIGDEFGDALNEVKRSIGGISTQVGLQFAPALTEAFKTISDAIAENRANILAFTQTLATQVGPVIKDVVNAFTGNDSAVVNKNFIAVRDTIVQIAQALGLVATIINTVFGLLVSLVQPFVDLWNGLTGQHVQAQVVIITGLILLMSGAFSAVSKGIELTEVAWGLLVKAFGSAAGTIALLATLFTGLIATIITTVEQAVATVQAWGAAFQEVWTGVSTFITSIWNGIVQGAQTMEQVLIAIVKDFQTKGLGAFTDLIGGIESLWKDLETTVQNIIAGIVKSIQAAIQSAVTLGGLLPGGGSAPTSGGNSGGGGFAGGGHVRGRGTSTSDSIWARLSNGEFVIKAEAVNKYGAGFLSAVNGLRYNAPTFAVGGPVGFSAAPMPSLDGMAPSGPTGRPFSLSIGGEVFDGLIAPDTVASKMVSFAKGKALRSAGRKPAWSK